MRALWSSAFLLRRLRGEVGVALIIFLLVAATAFLFGAGPRLFNQAADASLRDTVGGGTEPQRNVQFSILSEEPSDQPLVDARNQGDGLDARLPESLRGLVRGRAVAITSVRFSVEVPLRWVNSFISLGYLEGLTDAIELKEGRLPESTGQLFPPAAYGVPGEGEPQETIPRVEIALSDKTADELGVELGDVVPVRADGSDPMFPTFQAFAQPLRAEMEVVGIFRVSDPDADAWYGDRSMQLVRFAGDEDNPQAYATGLVAPTALADLVPSSLPFRYDWRFLVDPDRLDAGRVDGLLADVQRLSSQFLTSSIPSATGLDPVLLTGLVPLLRSYQGQRLASEAVLSVAAIGPLVLAAGAVGMVGVLLVSRRRATLALTRDRGATGLLLLGAELWEATLLVGSAAILGLLAAVLVVPGRASVASNILALAVAGAAIGALVAATWPAARTQLGHLHAEQAPVVGTSPRRLVLEGTAVFLAVGGIWLLRQRGLTIGGAEEVRFDPFLAATPALAGVAMGIVAMRLYPFPIRALGWLAARRRDLVPVLGLRTVGRHPAAANLPLLVLLLTAAFGSFASVVTSTVDRGQMTASWQNLGADYRIARVGGGPVTRVVDPSVVDGVEAVAAGYLDPVAGFRSEPNQRSFITLYALDPAAYDTVIAGSPISVDWPSEMTAGASAGEGIGTPANPIPAIITRRLPAASQPLQPGSTFQVVVAGQLLSFVDVEERDAFPGLPGTTTFVVAPFDLLQRAYVTTTLQPTLLMVRGPAGIGDALTATTRQQLPSAAVDSRHAAFQALQDAPLVAAVSIGFRVALLASAAYLALAVLAALTLTAAQRTRDLAFLRTLGVSARQALQLTLMEHGPPVVIALVPGVVLGIVVAFLLGPALGLSAFAGTDAALDLAIDWRAITFLAGGLLALVLAAIGVSTWMARRAQATDALRIGDD